MGIKATKQERLGARVSPELKRKIERAASIRGLSTSSFMVSQLERASEKVIAEHETRTLSERDQEAFFDALQNPPEPSARLKAAASRYLKK